MNTIKNLFQSRPRPQTTTAIGVVALLFAVRMIIVNPDLWRNDEHFMTFVALVTNGLNGIFGADQSKNGGISPGKTDG